MGSYSAHMASENAALRAAIARIETEKNVAVVRAESAEQQVCELRAIVDDVRTQYEDDTPVARIMDAALASTADIAGRWAPRKELDDAISKIAGLNYALEVAEAGAALEAQQAHEETDTYRLKTAMAYIRELERVNAKVCAERDAQLQAAQAASSAGLPAKADPPAGCLCCPDNDGNFAPCIRNCGLAQFCERNGTKWQPAVAASRETNKLGVDTEKESK